jgi:hypothetical protein
MLWVQPALAVNVLFYYHDDGGGLGTDLNRIGNALTFYGYTVTTKNVAASGYDPGPTATTGDNWASYAQVWDCRFDDANAGSGCPAPLAADNFDANWQSTAVDYVEHYCGNIYLQGENSGYMERNQGNFQFLLTAGGLKAGFQACGAPSGNGTMFGGTAGTFPMAGPAGLAGVNVTFADEGGIPDAAPNYLNGTSLKDFGGGTFGDGETRSSATVWTGAAQMVNFTGCNVGSVVNFEDMDQWSGCCYTGAVGTNVADGFVQAVALYFVNKPCVCASPTFTNTPTNTATNTVTATGTNTATNTATNSNTNTPTHTLTATPSSTPTGTPTNTATLTNTSTSTNTATETNTATHTATLTSTNTSTNTATNTALNTYTPTNTPTITDTNTFSPTGISTPTGTSTNTATHTVVNTTTNSPTNTGTSTPTMTASPTATNTLKATPSSTPTGTATNTAVDTFTDTNTPTNTATDTSTNTPTHTATATFTNSPVNTNTFMVTLTPTMTSTVTPTASVGVPGAYTVNIDIYNSAGEVVKTIPVQDFSQPINSITLSTSNQITALRGAGSTIQIYFDGVLIGAWNGSGNSGNPVTNGNYMIKVDSDSSTGVVTSVEQQATVNRQLSDIAANIYNSSGELVRALYTVVGEGSNVQMMRVSLSSSVLSLESNTGVSASLLQIVVNTTGTPVTLTWDGTNNLATDVTPGTYEIELHWDDGEGQTSDITRSVQVVWGTGGGSVIAEPNVLTTGQTLTTFNGTGIANAWTLKAKIYTIAGELVKPITGLPGTAAAQWNAAGMASGIYIAAVQVRDSNGGVLENQLLKVLVLH